MQEENQEEIDEEDEEARKDRESDVTLQLHFLRETIRRQCGVSHFNVGKSQPHPHLPERASHRLLQGLPSLLTKFSDVSTRLQIVVSLVPFVSPTTLGSVSSTANFRSLLRQLCALYLKYGSTECVDNSFQKVMTLEKLNQSGAAGDARIRGKTNSSMGDGTGDSDDDDDDDDNDRMEQTDRDIQLQEYLVNGGNEEHGSSVLSALSESLCHVGESNSTSTKREATREVTQLAKEIVQQFVTAVAKEEEEEGEEGEEGGEGALSACLALYRMFNLIQTNEVVLPTSFCERVHTLIEREMLDPQALSDLRAASVTHGLGILCSRFRWKFYKVFDSIRQERGDDVEEEEEKGKETKGKGKKKSKGKKKKGSSSSTPTKVQDEEEEADKEEEEAEKDAMEMEEDEDDEEMTEETEEEQKNMDTLIEMRDQIMKHVSTVFQNYREIVSDAEDVTEMEVDEKVKMSVRRMQMMVESTYQYCLDIMMLCTHRNDAEDNSLRRLAYTPTTSLSRMMMFVFERLRSDALETCTKVHEQQVRVQTLQEERAASAEARRQAREEEEEEEEEDESGSKKKKKKKKKKKPTKKKTSSNRRKIPLPLAFVSKSSATQAFENKVVEELLLPLYRWFQFSSKYGDLPNLDIGGMILRHCCQTRLNGPTNDLSKHFVKFLLEDIVLKKKGNSSSSSSSSSSSTENTDGTENTENTDEGFRLLLSIVKLALRQQYTSLGQEKKKRKTKTRQKSFLEEFATTLANKLGKRNFLIR